MLRRSDRLDRLPVHTTLDGTNERLQIASYSARVAIATINVTSILIQASLSLQCDLVLTDYSP